LCAAIDLRVPQPPREEDDPMKRLSMILACGLVMIAWTGALANPIPPKPQNPVKWSQKPDLRLSFDIASNDTIVGANNLLSDLMPGD
jgi:hypothetical protein